MMRKVCCKFVFICMMIVAMFFALNLGSGLDNSYAAKNKVKKSVKSKKPEYSRSFLKMVQVLLLKKGYKLGKADGFWGRNTRNALKKFQKDNKLKVTGLVDQKTKKILFSGKR